MAVGHARWSLRCLILLFVFTRSIFGQDETCSVSGRTVGLNVTDRAKAGLLQTGAFILHDYGTINCFGVVTTWTLFASSQCEDAWLQVWRPLPPGGYRLIGQNYFYAVSARPEHCPNSPREALVVYHVPENKQIPVQPGDMIGWSPKSGTSFGLVKFDDDASVTGKVSGCFAPDLSPGDICNRGDIHQMTIEFSFGAHVVQGPPPTLSNLPATVYIPENSPRYMSRMNPIYLVVASNAKNLLGKQPNLTLPDPAPINISITPPVDGFEITHVWDVGDEYLGVSAAVVLTEALDYERRPVYDVTVMATCLGLSSQATLTVQVLDLNEPHVITNLAAQVNVSALAVKPGDEIFRVIVSDTDRNTSAIRYFLQYPSSDVDPTPPFIVDDITGAVVVSQDLTLWVAPLVYRLNLTATDMHHIAWGVLTVYLLNTRQAPQVTNLPANVALPENVVNGSQIYQVAVATQHPEELKYVIVQVDPFYMTNKLAILQNGSVQVTSEGPVLTYSDELQRSGILVTILVMDSVLTSGLQLLNVSITWINQSPYFEKDEYWVTIPEKCGDVYTPHGNCPVEGLYMSVFDRELVHPPTTGEVCWLTCDILPGPAAAHFSFASSPAYVPCNELLNTMMLDVNDDPTVSTIHLTVRVTDTHNLTDTAEVHVTVVDINDHVPEVRPYGTITRDIEENTAVGTPVLQFTATDGDDGENANITFHLSDVTGSLGEYFFEVNRYTGWVTVRRLLDYEALATKQLSLAVTARDEGFPTRESTPTTLIINVLNINDESPEIPATTCSSHPYVEVGDMCYFDSELRTNVEDGHVILQFRAKDDDSADLHFELVNHQPDFFVDSTSGSLVTNISGDALNPYNRYDFIISAADMDDPLMVQRLPYVGRVDAYPAEEHEIDITICPDINMTSQVMARLTFCFQNDTYPHALGMAGWSPRLTVGAPTPGATCDAGRSSVFRIYTVDTSSYVTYESNSAPVKHFVGRRSLLKLLREDVGGAPTNDFARCMAGLSEFTDMLSVEVLTVHPAYPRWIIDTLAGRIVATILCLLGLALLVTGVVVLLCWMCKCCCFRREDDFDESTTKPSAVPPAPARLPIPPQHDPAVLPPSSPPAPPTLPPTRGAASSVYTYNTFDSPITVFKPKTSRESFLSDLEEAELEDAYGNAG